MSSTANSSANTSSIFGMSSGLQMPAVSQSQQISSTGPNGGLIFQAQPQQQQQPSIFGGAQSQDSQKSSSGISFSFFIYDFSQTPANNGESVSGLPASNNTGLNFAAAIQQDQAKNPIFSFSAGGLNSSGQQQNASGLKLNTGAQSSGGGLSLFNSKPGNGQQQNQSSIFSAGASTQQQPSQPTNSAGGLFNSQQQSTASGFAGFKFSAGADNSQTQQGSSFPSFNASSQASGSSAGFRFSAGASNAGGGLFQRSGSTPAQTNNQLAPGNSTRKSGVNFTFSVSALGNQQQQTPQQSQQSQSQGGVFAFGQKPNNSSGFNFSANGSTGLGLGNQSQNGSSGFNFSAGMGMNPSGGAGASGGVFNSGNSSQSNIFQNQVRQQQPNSNVFQTPQPQPQKQVSFITPTNQPSQGGFTFPANPSGLNVSFSAGTPRAGDKIHPVLRNRGLVYETRDWGSGRPVARARRRKK